MELNIWDLVDGRLFHNVLRLAPLDADLKSSLWKLLVELNPDIQAAAPSFSSSESAKAQEYVTALKTLREKSSNYSKLPLNKLSNEFVQKLMPGIHLLKWVNV